MSFAKARIVPVFARVASRWPAAAKFYASGAGLNLQRISKMPINDSASKARISVDGAGVGTGGPGSRATLISRLLGGVIPLQDSAVDSIVGQREQRKSIAPRRSC
jgi:hypothetical protein